MEFKPINLFINWRKRNYLTFVFYLLILIKKAKKLCKTRKYLVAICMYVGFLYIYLILDKKAHAVNNQ